MDILYYIFDCFLTSPCEQLRPVCKHYSVYYYLLLHYVYFFMFPKCALYFFNVNRSIVN